MKNNVIISKSFNKCFLSVLATWVVYQISAMLDTLMSGSFFNADALTGVGISCTFVMLMYVVMDSLSIGGSICIGNALGRGEKSEVVSSYFSLTVRGMFGIGGLLTIVALFFPAQIAFLFGARDATIAQYAIRYIRVFGLCVIPYGVNYLLQVLMLQFGYNKAYVINNILFLLINLASSLLNVKVFHMGVEGLALGSVIGTVSSLTFSGIAFFIRQKGAIKLSFHRIPDGKKKFHLILSRSLPTFSNNSTSIVLQIVQNNVVVLCLGTSGLTVLALMYSLKELLYIINGATDESVSTYISVLFGARDVAGIKQVIRSSLKLPMLSSVILTVLMFVFRVPLLGLFGVEDSALIATMTPFMLSYIFGYLLYNITYILSPLYANTGNPVYGMLCAVLPDTGFYLPIACLLVWAIGINGLWIGELIAYLLFFAALYFLISRRIKKRPRSLDDLMLLPKEYYDDRSVMSISIKKNMDLVTGISEKIQHFLTNRGADEKKAYYAALCLEELAVLIAESAKNRPGSYIDINVFMNGPAVKLSIRDNGPECNYLLYDPEDTISGIGIKIVRKIAEDVKYKYLVGLNMLNVEL